MSKYLLPVLISACLFSTVADARYYGEQDYSSYRRSQRNYQSLPQNRYNQPNKIEDETYKPRFYVGSELSYVEGNFKTDEYESENPEKNYANISFNMGMKLHENFGVEAFYQKSSEESKTSEEYWGGLGDISINMKTSFQAFGLDFIGYLPLSKEVELLAAVGLGEYKFKGDIEYSVKNSIPDHLKDDKLVTRFGVGMLYNMTNNIALRTMFRYIPVKNDYIKNITEASMGIRYTF